MDAAKDISAKIDAVQDLLTAKFGVRKRALPKMLRRTGRRLPRRLHARAQVLLEAQGQAGHPKLARQMDMAAVERAYEAITTYLQGIDVADRRRGVALGLAGSVAFNIIAVVTAFIAWMWWRGHL